MKTKVVKQLTFWIVGALFVFYSVGLIQETEPYRPGSGISGSRLNLQSSVQINDTGRINNPEAKSTQTEDNKRFKRESGSFECVNIEREDLPVITVASVGPCLRHCWGQRKDWSLLKQTDKCACMSNTDRFSKVDISNCDLECKGNKKQNCGGAHHYSKYKTGYYREPAFTKGSDVEVKRSREGCYILLKPLKKNSPRLVTVRMNPRMCKAFCAYNRYAYSGLNDGEICQCIKSLVGYFRSYSKRSNCVLDCPGDANWTCGSEELDQYEIYETDYTEDQADEIDERFEVLTWSIPPKVDDSVFDSIIPDEAVEESIDDEEYEVNAEEVDERKLEAEAKALKAKQRMEKKRKEARKTITISRKGQDSAPIKLAKKKMARIAKNPRIAKIAKIAKIKKIAKIVKIAKISKKAKLAKANKKYVIFGCIGGVIFLLSVVTCYKMKADGKEEEEEENKKVLTEKEKNKEKKGKKVEGVETKAAGVATTVAGVGQKLQK